MTIENFTLTYDEAVTLLDGLVEKMGPDYIYPGAAASHCEYFRSSAPDQPSCIVGHVLDAKGVTATDIHVMGATESNVYSVFHVTDHATHNHASGPLPVAARTFRLLQDVQEKQDRGVSWGAAVEYAKNLSA